MDDGKVTGMHHPGVNEVVHLHLDNVSVGCQCHHLNTRFSSF